MLPVLSYICLMVWSEWSATFFWVVLALFVIVLIAFLLQCNLLKTLRKENAELRDTMRMIRYQEQQLSNALHVAPKRTEDKEDRQPDTEEEEKDEHTLSASEEKRGIAHAHTDRADKEDDIQSQPLTDEPIASETISTNDSFMPSDATTVEDNDSSSDIAAEGVADGIAVDDASDEQLTEERRPLSSAESEKTNEDTCSGEEKSENAQMGTVVESQPETIVEIQPKTPEETQSETLEETKPEAIEKTEPEVIVDHETEAVVEAKAEIIEESAPEINEQSESEVIEESEPEEEAVLTLKEEQVSYGKEAATEEETAVVDSMAVDSPATDAPLEETVSEVIVNTVEGTPIDKEDSIPEDNEDESQNEVTVRREADEAATSADVGYLPEMEPEEQVIASQPLVKAESADGESVEEGEPSESVPPTELEEIEPTVTPVTEEIASSGKTLAVTADDKSAEDSAVSKTTKHAERVEKKKTSEHRKPRMLDLFSSNLFDDDEEEEDEAAMEDEQETSTNVAVDPSDALGKLEERKPMQTVEKVETPTGRKADVADTVEADAVVAKPDENNTDTTADNQTSAQVNADGADDATLAAKDDETLDKEEIDAIAESLEKELSFLLPVYKENLTREDKHFCQQLDKTVKARMCNANFNVDELVAKLKVGRTSFFKRVKELTGLSPNDYIRNCRLLLAVELLMTTDMPINEVAERSGIPDPMYFSRVFKNQFGCTPKQFKNKFS